MIKHVVLLKVAPHVEDTAILAILTKLGNLRYSTIPEILSFSCGKNNSPENINQGYNFGFVMEFESPATRDKYVNHKDHVALVQNEILPLVVGSANSALAFDYESDVEQK